VFPLRKWIAIVCLAALLLALLTPPAYATAFAILAPFWLLFAILLLIAIRSFTADPRPASFPFVAVYASRAPPVL